MSTSQSNPNDENSQPSTSMKALIVDGIVQQIRAGENEKALENTRALLMKYENQKDVLGLLFELSFRLHYLLGNFDSAYQLAYYSLTSYENLGDNWRMRFADSYMVAEKLFTMANSKEFSFKVPCDHLKLAFDLYAHALKYADEVPDYLEGGKYGDESTQLKFKENIQLKFKILEKLLTEKAGEAEAELVKMQVVHNTKKQRRKKDKAARKEAMAKDETSGNKDDQEREDEVKGESRDDLEREDEHTKDKDKQVKGKDENKEGERLTFDVPFTVCVDRRSVDGHYQGTIATGSIIMKRSFVSGTPFHTQNFSRLQSLCASNKCLLSVENLIKHPLDNTSLLVCESAYGIGDFFKKELELIKQTVSKKLWWEHISVKFRIIFRDVVRGLMFLYKEGLTCGDLGFNIFVTPTGRGKILPSLDPSLTGKEDVRNLISKMKTVILFPFSEESSVEDSEFGLPEELLRFFSDVRLYLGKVSPSFLVDHPFFWTRGERIDFVKKFSNFLAVHTLRSDFQKSLVSNDVFNDWSQHLKGVYIQIWKKGDPDRHKSKPPPPLPLGAILVKDYKSNIDIVRFFGAAYKHVNDYEYRAYRSKDIVSENEVEKDLSEYFPRFYVDIFACLCVCVEKGNMTSDMLKLVSSCYYRDEELFIMEEKPVRVLVDGATGKFGGALLQLIAKGVMLGEHQLVILYITDGGQNTEALGATREKLVNAGYPLLRDVIANGNVGKASKDVDIAILSQNFSLDQIAAPNCKVLVVSVNANTDALIVRRDAPSIPVTNISCLTRLEHNKALYSISERLGVKVTDVKNVIIWGKNLSSQNLDVNHARVKTSLSEKSVREVVKNDEWLDGDLVKIVQQSGPSTALIEDGDLPRAACDHIRDWVFGTPEDTWISMGVYSDGSLYDVPDGIFFSFPVTCVDGEWKIVEGLTSDTSRQNMNGEMVADIVKEKSIRGIQ